ncbi:TetR/AcrR family transcriptional regulator [Arcanobacterium buesumense]|uniref:TetR/AcrR family transcriptional regulator n=1 Tax=Arcanobacterium buesumense TaxID=2722751 RepID=A0A6H2EMK2_9ACTO|nr:TetR/AcrR family transcriptional regulator [Arcanobacterium buesumense]QJC22282.1 TetR/AcrR family transcriptional regulator [Arcanobacterium buesumense]
MTQSTNQSIGRPRDPAIDKRLLQATIELYGEYGWHTLTMTQIAKHAGVGKSALYNRWKTKTAIIHDAFTQLIKIPEPTGTTLREILYNEASFRLYAYLGEYSKPLRRLLFEAATIHEPEIYALYQSISREPTRALVRRLWDFKISGEIPESVSCVRITDALEGSILMRTFYIAADQKSCFISAPESYLSTLVDELLALCHKVQP